MAYIIQRNNRFYVVAYDGLDPLTGKERRRWHPAGSDRHEAEQMAAVEVQSVYVGIAGGHIRGFSSLGQVSMRNREVTEEDVDRVIENARAVQIPADRAILHTVPQDFLVDEKSHSVTLTDSGVDKVEARLKIPNLYDVEHIEALNDVGY